MDKEAKAGGSALPGQSGILVVLLLAAGALVLHEPPLQGTRPAANEPRIDQQFSEQDIDARLWQDPFGAIERGREQLAKKIPQATLLASENARHGPAALRETIANKINDFVTEVDILAVMVPGGPYAEQVESRRRTRYAVVAGLSASHYAPIDTEHIGYFLPEDNDGLPHALPPAVTYEWFEPAPTDRSESGACRPPQTQALAASAPASEKSACRHVLVLWLDSGAFRQQPFKRIAALVGQLVPEKQSPPQRWRVLGPTDSGGLRSMVEESNAPEFDATFFRDRDIRFYSASATVPDSILLERVRSHSDNGDVHSRFTSPCQRPPVNVAPSVTPPANEPAITLADYFSARCISLVRTIGDDQKLVASLIRELKLRLLPQHESVVEPSPPLKEAEDVRTFCRDLRRSNSTPRIAVVTELDTLYGRSLRRQFEYDAAGWTGFCVDRFQYVRGIDGLPPERSNANAASSDKEAPGAKTDTKDTDGSLVERAEGQSQLDYLRRLAGRLRDRDKELRAQSEGNAGIRSIGVLGNDLHDKLLVLQALKPEFPDAVFFTTDLDARFLHPREQSSTRNLIVASNFDLRLTDRLQSGAPPFRDTYQTSAFFATSLAMAEINNYKPFQWTQSEVTKRLQGPRMFEIGRTSAFSFPTLLQAAPNTDPTCDRNPAACSAGSPPPRLTAELLPPAAAAPTSSAAQPVVCRNSTFDACDHVHPPPSPAYPAVNRIALWMVCAVLLFLLWAPALALSRPTRRRMRRLVSRGNRRWRRIALVTSVLIVQVSVPLIMALSWPAFAHWLTDGGKPISFSEGISIWPTEAIRLLTLLLCGYLVCRGWTALQRNLDQISLDLRIGKTRRQLVAEQDRQDESLVWWQRIANMFFLSRPYAGPLPADAASDPRMTAGTMEFWKRFIVQNRTSSRFVRSAACVAAMTLLGSLLYGALDESPGVPVRGGISDTIHKGLAFLLFLAANFLTFCVADATLLCARLVRELRWRSTNWPERSLHWFQSRLGALPPALTDHWIDLQFIAQRTRCVTGLVYYPFIVLSLVPISRSAVFDNWRMPLALPLMTILSLGVVLACVVALRQLAESSRTHALVAVKEARLRAQARDAKDEPPPQQLELLQRHIEELREGAFAPFTQQPLLKALVMPFATWGGTALLDYMAMANI